MHSVSNDDMLFILNPFLSVRDHPTGEAEFLMGAFGLGIGVDGDVDTERLRRDD